MNCNTTHYRANSSSVPGDPTASVSHAKRKAVRIAKLVRTSYGSDMRDEVTLAGLAHLYGVNKTLIPFVVSQAQLLLRTVHV